MTLVRSNSEGEVGFLGEKRRLNGKQESAREPPSALLAGFASCSIQQPEISWLALGSMSHWETKRLDGELE